MDSRSSNRRSQLFTLRVWTEEVSDGHMEWRGRVQHTAGGETFYFRDWDALIAFLRSASDAQFPEGVARDETEA